MGAFWWPLLAAVMVLALIATLVDGWGRGGRRPKPRAGARRPRRGRRTRRTRGRPPPG